MSYVIVTKKSFLYETVVTIFCLFVFEEIEHLTIKAICV